MSLDLDQVHQDMLAAIPDRYQKTVGFPAYDLTLAFALAVLSLDGDVSAAEAHLNVDNLTGVDLDEFVKQHRGLSRKYATYATAVLRVVTGSGTIQAGDLFSTSSGVEFYAISDGTYAAGDTFTVRAYVAGDSGNVGPGTITYMPVTIAGIAAVINDQAASGGYNAESDDDFRDRYYADLQEPNNGNNQQAYTGWAMSIPGVGRAKLFPQAFGANTIEICIVDANMEPAGSSLIHQVQAYIDPNQNGDGAGEAAMGAACTVTTAETLTISISASVILADGYDLETVTAAVAANLTAYLREIAFKKDTTYLSYSQVGTRINKTDGVFDHSALMINGSAGNVEIGDRQTPVLWEVTLA